MNIKDTHYAIKMSDEQLMNIIKLIPFNNRLKFHYIGRTIEIDTDGWFNVYSDDNYYLKVDKDFLYTVDGGDLMFCKIQTAEEQSIMDFINKYICYNDDDEGGCGWIGEDVI